MQPDGYIKIKDRSKDIIISGGREHLLDRSRGRALPPPGGDRRGGGGDARREVGRNAVRVRGTGRPFLFSRPTCDCGLTWRGSTWWSKHSFNASDCEIPPCRAVRPTLLPPP